MRFWPDSSSPSIGIISKWDKADARTCIQTQLDWLLIDSLILHTFRIVFPTNKRTRAVISLAQCIINYSSELCYRLKIGCVHTKYLQKFELQSRFNSKSLIINIFRECVRVAKHTLSRHSMAYENSVGEKHFAYSTNSNWFAISMIHKYVNHWQFYSHSSRIAQISFSHFPYCGFLLSTEFDFFLPCHGLCEYGLMWLFARWKTLQHE